MPGGIAQLVRAFASHARGPRFEPVCLHHNTKKADEQNVHQLFCSAELNKRQSGAILKI